MIKSPVKSVVRDASPYLTGLLRSVSRLAFDFKDLVGIEKAGGNANVFYNPADLTSLRTDTFDGSGGIPSVGDPVGIMLNSSGISGSMQDYLNSSAQPNLWDAATFSDALSVGTGSAVNSNGDLTITNPSAGNYGKGVYTFAATVGNVYHLTATAACAVADIYFEFTGAGTLSGTGILRNYNVSASGTEINLIIKATSVTPSLGFQIAGNATGTATITDVKIVEIPSHVALAPSDAARPILMDDPDLTWSDLTDNGNLGPNIFTRGTLTLDPSWTDNGDGSFTTASTNGYTFLSAPLPVEIGQKYEITFEIYDYNSGTVLVKFPRSADAVGVPVSGNGIYTAQSDFTLEGSNFYFISTSFSGSIRNISIRKVNTAFDGRGAELTTNGDFSDGLTGWTESTSAGPVTVIDGVARISSGGGFLNSIGISVATEVGKIYEVTADFIGGTSPSVYLIKSDTLAGAAPWGGPNRIDLLSAHQINAYGSRKVKEFFEATATTSRIHILNYTDIVGQYVDVDNISVKEIKTPNLLFNGTVNSTSSKDDSTFRVDTGNWTKGTGWSIGSGVASCDGTQVSTSLLQIPISATAEKFYKVQVYVSGYSAGSLSFQIGSQTIVSSITANGHYNNIGRYFSGPATLYAVADASFVGSIDNVIIQELPSATPTSYYLDTDGVDDRMNVTPTLDLGEEWWHTGAWKFDTPGQTWSFTTSDTYHEVPWGFGSQYRMYISGGSVETLVLGDTLQKHIATFEQAGTNSITGRFNGATGNVLTPHDDMGVTQGLALFTRSNTSWLTGINGRFYGGAWGQGQVDYDELDTLQKYLGTTARIEPTEVTPHTNVYDMLSAQTAAALFDIDDTTSLTTYRDGRITQPVDGDPVGQMMSVAGTNGDNISSAQKTTIKTLADFPGGSGPDNNEWTQTSQYVGGTNTLVGDASGYYKVTADVEVLSGADWSLYFRGAPGGNPHEFFEYNNIKLSAGRHTVSVERFYDSGGNMYCNLEPRSTTNFGTVRVYSITVEHIPGYVATAPSDAARPTLASVLDETASELTDDGTRGPELVTNGTFDTDISGWTALNADASVSGGVVTVLNTSAFGYLEQNIDLEVGATYEFTYDRVLGNPYVSILGEFGTPSYVSNSTSNSITFTVSGIVGQATRIRVGNQAAGIGVSSSFDNVSLKRIGTVFDGRGDELVTGDSSTFTSGFGDWAYYTGATASVSGGAFSMSGLGTYTINGLLTIGRAYEVSFDWTRTSNSADIFVGDRVGPSSQVTTGTGGSLSGSSSGIIVAGISVAAIGMRAVGGTITIDNISIKEVLTPNLLLTSAGDDDSTFDTDTGNWNKGVGWTISGGTASHTGNAGSFQQSTLVEQYKWYALKFYVSSISGGSLFVRIGDPSNNDLSVSTTGWHEVYAQADGTYLNFFASTGVTVDIDNVIVQEVPASVARAFYLDFDGLDDRLDVYAPEISTGVLNGTVTQTFQSDAGENTAILFGNPGGSYILAIDSGTSTTISSSSVLYRKDGTIATYAVRADAKADLLDQQANTILVENATLTSFATHEIGGNSVYNSYSLDGRIYSWAAVDTRLDGRDRDLLENYMISKKP